jgi:ribose transport system substrate-binding protein
MKKHRHLIALVPVLLLVAAGCSSGKGNATDTTAAAAATTAGDAATTAASGAATSAGSAASASGEKITIVASVPPTDHGWLGQIAAKAQAAADTFPDVDFRLLEAADADSQASQIETVINEHPDALVVLPYDGAQLTPVAEKAMEAGIPVVNVDRLFSSPDAARATILGDNYQIGVKAATFIADKLSCNGNVVEIQGIAGISVTTDRTKGFADTIKALCGDGLKIVAQQPADFQPDKGLQVMEAILQANSQIDAVYTHDDDMAEGVVAAIENAGRQDEMILTGAGGSCKAFDRIEAGGLYAATYLYSPTMAGSAVNMARLIAQGKGFSDLIEPEVPSMVVVPPSEVSADTVDSLRSLCFD